MSQELNLGIDELITTRVVERLRGLEPSAGAVLVTGSYARGRARPDSDFDVTAITRTKPQVSSRMWFEPRADRMPLHVSAGAETAEVWREDEGEAASWALGFPARDTALYLWFSDDVRDTLGDDPSIHHPAASPEIEGVVECVAKARGAREPHVMRWHAHDTALFVPSVLLLWNEPRVVTDRTDALDAALSMRIAPPHYREDLPALLGLRPASDAEVAASLQRLATELFAFLRERADEIPTEDGIAEHIADGAVERHLGL